MIDASVVRIVNHQQLPDWFSPWDLRPVRAASGSGFIVDGGLVLTSAHVVSDARLLLMFLPGDPTPYEAKVHAVGHDCDLALLRPIDPLAFRARAPLQLAGLPRLRSTVETYGYPEGGRQMSSTRGVVSRIEPLLYSHPGNEYLLAVQTDAAINPGNSGGPVLQDGRVVGVAFQAAMGLQNVGYFIPTEVVRHFWTDAHCGSYQGFPALGARLQNLENAAQRRAVGIGDGETGAIVDLVYPGSSADGHLLPGDILLEIDGMVVANDRSVELLFDDDDAGPDGATLRMDLAVVVDRHQVGDSLSVSVLRQQTRLQLQIPLIGWAANRRFAHQHDTRPRYFVYAGLVFLPLDREMLMTFGPDWWRVADKVLMDEHLLRPYRELEHWFGERVVLMRRLAHSVNAGFASYRNTVIERVNGRKISGLADVVAAFDNPRGRFHVVEFYNEEVAVLDREAAEAAHQPILDQYAVIRDRHLP